MEVLQAIILAAALVALAILAGAFIIGVHSSMVNSWKEWKHRDKDLIPERVSEDPFWVAVTATVFAVFFYGVIALAAYVVVSW